MMSSQRTVIWRISRGVIPIASSGRVGVQIEFGKLRCGVPNVRDHYGDRLSVVCRLHPRVPGCIRPPPTARQNHVVAYDRTPDITDRQCLPPCKLVRQCQALDSARQCLDRQAARDWSDPLARSGYECHIPITVRRVVTAGPRAEQHRSLCLRPDHKCFFSCGAPASDMM